MAGARPGFPLLPQRAAPVQPQFQQPQAVPQLPRAESPAPAHDASTD
jgi:hypothetical protein